ncbi:DASS family sodium-coupled anion symporter [Endozoicomonas ascidiicola]|uniref:DASS family sodium-coupled anion symporter n=1 Tax=Endozoicomonas ascidiicola TaxID=1698521 RepID=UPI000B0EEACD|nr:DASS family sodium-coupled anion symporter [Endozoicomonas ascidiicola]
MRQSAAGSEETDTKKINFKVLSGYLIPFSLGLFFWLLPAPEGLDDRGWHMLIIFLSTLLGVMLAPAPMSAVTLVGLTVLGLTGTLSIKEALSGYGDPVTWLSVLAFFISHGFIKTGLGMRIAYCFMRILGRRTLTLAYGLTLTDLFLAPAMPSITARAGAVVHPIMKSIAHIYDSHPGPTANRLGRFLTLVVFHGNAITSGMFLTAMAGNPMILSLAGSQGIEITWGSWALAAIVPGVISLIIMPLALYKLVPPELTKTPGAVSLAKEKMAQLGPLKRDEWIMLATFIVLLLLWVFGLGFGVVPTLVAMLGVSLLILTGVLDWQDVIGNKGAWDTMIWFGAFITMAHYLSAYGVVQFTCDHVGGLFSGFSASMTLLMLCVIYYLFHYFFAAATAQISAMYTSFLLIILAAGISPLGGALMLAFMSSLCGVITHYGNGPAPILFGAGYVSLGSWWFAGIIMSLLYLSIWLGPGILWLEWLGYL